MVRTLFFAAAAVTALMFASFYVFFNPKPSMQSFKRSGSREAAAKILQTWEANGSLRTARANLTFDWFFIAAYSTLWISAALYLGRNADPRLHVLALLIAATGIAGAICDVVENLALREMLYGNASESAPVRCRAVMPWNVGLFAVTLTCVVVAAVIRR